MFPEEPRQPGNRNPERLRNLCGRQRFAQMSAQILLDPTEQLRSRLRAADPAGEFVQQGVERRIVGSAPKAGRAQARSGSLRDVISEHYNM